MGFDTERAQWNKRQDSKNGLEDRRLSICTECRHGIFKGQDYEWTSEGLKHGYCILTKAA